MQRHHPYGGYDQQGPARGGFGGRGRGRGGPPQQQVGYQAQGRPPPPPPQNGYDTAAGPMRGASPGGRGRGGYGPRYSAPPPIPPAGGPGYTYPPPGPPVPPFQNGYNAPPPVAAPERPGYAARPPPAQNYSQPPAPGYGQPQGPGYAYSQSPPPPPQTQPSFDHRDHTPMSAASDPEKRRKDYDAEGAKIENRIRREKPCRVLFVRNVKYDTDTTQLRERFGAVGEMKSFFDLVSTRGLIFITYYDLRTAISARDAMQGFTIAGRPIDVHYSLPRDEENANRKCDRDRNQGTLRVVLRDGRTSLQEQELDRMFRGFGAIKGIYFSGGDPSRERLLEFFDSRAMSDAYDRMNHVPYPAGGHLELFFDWDVKDIPLNNPPPAETRAPGVGPDGRGPPAPPPKPEAAPPFYPPSTPQFQGTDYGRPPSAQQHSTSQPYSMPTPAPPAPRPPIPPRQNGPPLPPASMYPPQQQPPFGNAPPMPPPVAGQRYPPPQPPRAPPSFPPPSTPAYGQPTGPYTARNQNENRQAIAPSQSAPELSNLLASLGQLPPAGQAAPSASQPPYPPQSSPPQHTDTYRAPSGYGAQANPNASGPSYAPPQTQSPERPSALGTSAVGLVGSGPLPPELAALLSQHAQASQNAPHDSYDGSLSSSGGPSQSGAPVSSSALQTGYSQPSNPDSSGQVNALLAMLKSQQS